MENSAAVVVPELFQQIRGSTRSGRESELVEKILRGYFSGKRDALRTYKFLEVQVQGKRGTFNAMAVDISRSGILLRIMDSGFAESAEMNHLMPYTARVWHHFEGGFGVLFNGGSLKVSADVVRVTGYSGRGSSLILLGCRFRRDLTPEQCRDLGIDHREDLPPGDSP
jgi:hypothetical protein